MISMLSLLIAFAPGMSRDDPIPPPREKEAFRFTILINTREGFGSAAHLTLEKNGNLYATNGRRVKDDDIGFYCISEPEKKDQKLVLQVLAPADVSAGKLIGTIEKIQIAARDRKVHLTVSILIPSP
jgi:hypothetical protein